MTSWESAHQAATALGTTTRLRANATRAALRVLALAILRVADDGPLPEVPMNAIYHQLADKRLDQHRPARPGPVPGV